MVKGKHSASSTDKANKPEKRRNYSEISWYQCQCSGSSQIPCQDDINYHQFLSLYQLSWSNDKTLLVIYNTENKKIEVKVLDADIILDECTSITQLPNGELFCYGSIDSGTTVIIDRSHGTRMLPPGTRCDCSSALYFDSNIYCFGGANKRELLALSRKFDLEKNRWKDLASLPECDIACHSVIFNGNILISGYKSKNLWLYSIEIDSFSIIPYDFECNATKLLINVERLYLIEWGEEGLSIYESEDEYYWKPISKSGQLYDPGQIYCLYNKDKIYISTEFYYYQFDLKEKVMLYID